MLIGDGQWAVTDIKISTADINSFWNRIQYNNSHHVGSLRSMHNGNILGVIIMLLLKNSVIKDCESLLIHSYLMLWLLLLNEDSKGNKTKANMIISVAPQTCVK